MPLPPLPEDNTPRAWLKYTFGGITHELCVRPDAALATSAVLTVLSNIANALKPSLPAADSFSAVRYAAAGSTLSFPLAWTPIAGTGSVSPTDTDKAQFVALSGRSGGGYRCRVTFFTQNWPESGKFRLTTGTAGAASQLYNAIVTAGSTLTAIDGQPVVWNGYVNAGYNAYWQRQQR